MKKMLIFGAMFICMFMFTGCGTTHKCCPHELPKQYYEYKYDFDERMHTLRYENGKPVWKQDSTESKHENIFYDHRND